MNDWSDAMKDVATITTNGGVATRTSALPDTRATSWDPHEVWLTRIKQPRESAARRAISTPVRQSLGSSA